MMKRSSRLAILATLLALVCAGCAPPVLSRDGQLVFAQPGGTRGASVLTAHGVEFLDRADIPKPVLRRSAHSPWEPATGFLLPADGVWRQTSKPTALHGRGLAVVLRSSDAFVPSWGGEILLRLDALVPATAYPDASVSIRPPRVLAIVLDGHTSSSAPLIDAALGNIGQRDRALIIDSSPARVILPMIAGSHRSLLSAAVERVTQSPVGRMRNLAMALALARTTITASTARPPQSLSQVLVVTDGVAVPANATHLQREVRMLQAKGIHVTAVSAADQLPHNLLAPLGHDTHVAGTMADRQEMIAEAVPPPGDVVLDDVTLVLSSAPAPLRVLELSGGDAALSLESDKILLGELYAGEARTEVARVAVPIWVPGEPLDIDITAIYRDVASGETLSAKSSIRCLYSNDVERIATSRHGDVIAYASALAMVRRLHRAFVGSQVDKLGGFRSLVAWQARSLATLGKVQRDPALSAQAEVLNTLLGAVE